jgi:ABC-2 type transport system ATP-binding protein
LPNVTNIIDNTFDINFSYTGDDNGLVYILSQIVQGGIPVISYKEKEGNLEDIFMQLTGGEQDA